MDFVRNAIVSPHNIKYRGRDIPGLVQWLRMSLRTQALLPSALSSSECWFLFLTFPPHDCKMAAKSLGILSYITVQKRPKGKTVLQILFIKEKNNVLLALFLTPVSVEFPSGSNGHGGPWVHAPTIREAGKVCTWHLQSPCWMADSVC